MKKASLIVGFALTATLLVAGDLAVLENMGFSSDGRYFMFGQHVLVSNVGQAYAEIGIVDVSRNEFVSGGWKKSTWDVPMIPNQSSRGALYEILGKIAIISKQYGIQHLKQGRMLYTKSFEDEKSPDANNDAGSLGLSFRDFEWGRDYILELNQSNQNVGDEIAAAFHIRVTIEDSEGAMATYNVGRSSLMRQGIAAYSIARVWIGPKGKSLIIAVAKEASDLSVRYMVETLIVD